MLLSGLNALICTGLRAPEEQLWLSRLSQAPAVHLIASIDHVNAGLLWDNCTAAAFRWLWLDVTSYAAYKAETSSALPILTSECGGMSHGSVHATT
jgi:origin recognition complex subunit 2